MSHSQCSPEENIVRAIHSAHWDERRPSSLIFKGEKNSVSRLAILSLDEIFHIFHLQLDTSPNGIIIGAGEINVQELRQIGQQFNPPTTLTVEQDPKPGNPAHAEIPQKISRGLAKAIINALIFHRDMQTSSEVLKTGEL